MQLLPRRSLLAVAIMADIALHSRPHPVSAKSLAVRHALPARHLEGLLSTLMRSGLLKGLRGPKGGYELARERRRITIGEIVRASTAPSHGGGEGAPLSKFAGLIIGPALDEASALYLKKLDSITLADVCRAAEANPSLAKLSPPSNFTI